MNAIDSASAYAFQQAFESVHRLGKRIEPQRLLRHHGQTVDARTKVNGGTVQIDSQPFVEAEHRSLPSDSMSVAMCCASVPCSSSETPLGSRACSVIGGAQGWVG